MTIIDEIKQEKKIINEDYAKLLSDAGFPKITTQYPIITPQAIEEYLKGQAKKFKKIDNRNVLDIDVSDSKLRELSSGFYIHFRYKFEYLYEWMGLIKTKRKIVKDWNSADLSWVENDISTFKSIPPKHVLENIIEATNKFDEMKIVTVELSVDPLVVGINNGSDLRYLIDWWDKDIDIEEINLI